MCSTTTLPSNSLAATLGISLVAHFAVIAVVAVAAFATPPLLDDRAPAPTRRRGVVWSAPLLLIGGAAFCLNFAEGSATNWAAVHLRESLAANPGTAGLAVTAFLLAMAAGRLRGWPGRWPRPRHRARHPDRAGRAHRVCLRSAPTAERMKDHLQEPARDAVESVKSAAGDAGSTVVDQTRSAAADVASQVESAKDKVTG